MAINTNNNEINADDYKQSPYNITSNAEITAESMRNALVTKQSALPIGSIIMYHNHKYNWVDNQTLPGWYACTEANASRGCPDLVGKFVRGVRTSAEITDGPSTGPNSGIMQLETAHLPAHEHTFTAADHTHSTHSHSTTQVLTTHTVGGTYAATLNTSGYTGLPSATGAVYGGGNGQTLGNAFGILPRYYSLIYIMRVR